MKSSPKLKPNNYYYYQDGGDFYLFYDKDGIHLVKIVSYDRWISDWDTDGAREAKNWFISIYCKKNNIYVRDAT